MATTQQQPTSTPFARPQPEAASYGTGELALFQTFTRASYREAFGVQAPPYDPSRPIQSWFDSTADTSSPDNVAVYKVLARNAAGEWRIRQLVIPAQEAASVNLAGKFEYPAYEMAPTAATRGGGSVNPIYLSTEAVARALMEQFGGVDLADEGVSSVFPVTYPPGEERRLWYFMFRGNVVNAGALLYIRNKRGVGSPGHWDVSGAAPTWVPDPEGPTGVHDVRPPQEMPIRDLLPNERLQEGLMGIHIVRTDREQEAVEQAGYFTPDDREMLREVRDLVARLSRP